MAVAQVHRGDTYRSVSGSRDFLTQAPQDQAVLQAEFDDAQVVTLQFSVISPGAIPFSCKVTAKFSDGGQTVVRQFHAVNGTQISGVGRVIDIHAIDDTPLTTPDVNESGGGPTPGAGSKYTLFVIAAPGVRATNARHPALWGGSYLVGASGNVIVQIPQKAGPYAISIHGSSGVANGPLNLAVVFEDGAGNTWGQASVDADNQGDPIALIPNTTQVQIFNLDSTNPVILTINWPVDG
jgi:hypothetical protein